MMDLAMNFDADECLVTAMFDKGNRNDTMEAIDHIIPFLKGDSVSDLFPFSLLQDFLPYEALIFPVLWDSAS